MTDRGIRAGVRRLFQIALRTPQRARADADAELRAFLDARIDDLVHRGMTQDEARAEAIRRLGGSIEDVSAQLRHSAELREKRLRYSDTADGLVQDCRYAIRTLRRRPGFVATAVLCLAVGIGANATMFGVVDALLLRPPAQVRDPGGLYWIRVAQRASAVAGGFTSYDRLGYSDYANFSRSPSVTGAAAYATSDESFGRGADARQVNVLRITHTFMPLLDVQPALGRFFGADEDRVGATPVAVLSYGLWQGQFAGAPDVIGRAVRVNTTLYTVVGVAPRDFNGVDRTRVDLYLPPVAGNPYASEILEMPCCSVDVLVRLQRGVGPERLAGELNTLYHNARSGDTARAADAIVVASSTQKLAMGSAQQIQNATVAVCLAGMAAVVLLVVCANVASLLLTRAVGRRREIAVRLALGIGRGRLIRMLMTESLMLAALGGVVSLVVGQWGGGLVRAALLSDIAMGSSMMDPRVLAVTVAATVLTGVACGLVPVLHTTRPDLTTALKAGERTGTERRSRTLSVLLVAQVALTLVLLAGAGLFVRSLRNLDRLDLGFDVTTVLVAPAGTVHMLGYTPVQTDRYSHELRDRVAGLPGVRSAALASGGPFADWYSMPVAIPGGAADTVMQMRAGGVTPDFFGTLGMSLRGGRNFSSADRAGAPRVAIVNETMARRYWPAGDAVGKCIQIGSAYNDTRPDTMPCTTVVGIVHPARQGDLFHQPIQDEQPTAEYYVPFDQQALADRLPYAALYVRTAGEAERAVPLVRRTMESLAPDLPYPDVVALSSALAPQIRPWRLGVQMFGVFGGIALLLAVVGLYGVLAFHVTQRTHEIGVRVALGAQRDDVHSLVMGQGFVLGALGIAIGLGVVLIAAPALGRLVYGVSPRDPLVLVSAAVTLLTVVAIASYLPARRAAAIDPMRALQEL